MRCGKTQTDSGLQAATLVSYGARRVLLTWLLSGPSPSPCDCSQDPRHLPATALRTLTISMRLLSGPHLLPATALRTLTFSIRLLSGPSPSPCDCSKDPHHLHATSLRTLTISMRLLTGPSPSCDCSLALTISMRLLLGPSPSPCNCSQDPHLLHATALMTLTI